MAGEGKVNVEPLDLDNYSTWAVRMQALLAHKGLDAAITQDGGTAVGSATDKKALALLTLHVKDVHLTTVSSSGSARAAWTALEELYRAKNLARQLLLRRELSSLKMANGEAVATYSTRARTLWADLLAAGDDVSEKEVAIAMLCGLTPEYNTVVTILEMDNANLVLSTLSARLMQVEQRVATQQHATDSAFIARGAKTRRHPTGASSNQHSSSGHWAHRGNGDNKGSSVQGKTCYYCGKKGHLQRDCFKKKREEGAHGQRPAPGRGNGVALTAAKSFTSTGDWLMDSGASCHMTPNQEQLEDYQSLDRPEPITFGNGEQGRALGRGQAWIKTNRCEIRLMEVLYVPELTVSLFSITAATSRGASISFHGQKGKISVNGTVIADVSGVDNLYYLTRSKGAAGMAAHKSETPELWHRRFGHLGFDNLARLQRDNMVNGIHVTPESFQASKERVCGECISAKQTRQPFTRSEREPKRALELLHMDVCGPMQEPSLGGSRYVATFLDDYTKLSLVRTVAHKSGVPAMVKEVVLLLENLGNQRVRSIRTDRGGEYLNANLAEFLHSKGIQHQTTAPYTPEQNGAAERLNRTLVERVRAMLLDANLPHKLWAEAMVTANYIRNRSPTTSKARTPWEHFFNEKPDVAHLRVFGSAAHVHVNKHQRRKLDAVSARGTFVGYEPNSKAYRVYMEETSKIVISRDVIFDETPGQPVDGSKQQELTTLEEEQDEEQEDQPMEEAEDVNMEGNGGDGGYDAPGGEPQEPRFPGRARRAPAEWWRSTRQRTHMAALATAAVPEPQSYEEAIQREDAKLWKEAMDEEMASLWAHDTWTLEPLPPGVKPIPVKWVYKEKRRADGTLERLKARLVAKGFRQRDGIDYNEVFAPVSKYTTVRAFLAKVAAEDLELHQLDIKTAFLNGDLEEDIWMAQPEGYKEGGAGMACHLKKALYGLKQAPRAWHHRLKTELEACGFKVTEADAGLFTLHDEEAPVYMPVYVDDLLLASKSTGAIIRVKERLGAAFDVRDLGEADYFLSMKVERDRAAGTLSITQPKLTAELIEKFGMTESNGRTTPLSPALRLETPKEGEELDTTKYPYQELVGSLLYLSVCTRPDISQAVGVLARHMSNPGKEHWQAAKGVLRYLTSTKALGITFGGGMHSELECYCDADYAGDINTRRSTTGYVFILNGGAISWNSKLQPTVAASTVEAEYMAASSAVKEALWIRRLLMEMDVPIDVPIIKCDSQGAIKLLKHPIASQRSKHIDVIHHFVRERVMRKEVSFEYCNTKQMVADMLTKPLAETGFVKYRAAMGIA